MTKWSCEGSLGNEGFIDTNLMVRKPSIYDKVDRITLCSVNQVFGSGNWQVVPIRLLVQQAKFSIVFGSKQDWSSPRRSTRSDESWVEKLFDHNLHFLGFMF